MKIGCNDKDQSQTHSLLLATTEIDPLFSDLKQHMRCVIKAHSSALPRSNHRLGVGGDLEEDRQSR